VITHSGEARSLIREQQKLREQGIPSFRVLEEVAHQNVKVFQQSVAAMLQPSASSEAARNSH